MKKLTKIVATISDLRASTESLREMLDAGMNVVRLNTAHQAPEDAAKVLKLVREVDSNIPVMLDTKGPEVRTTKAEDKIPVEAGEKIEICDDVNLESSRELLSVNYSRFCSEVPVGSEIMIDDGDISLTVESANNGRLQCVVNNSGKIGGKKSVNVPGVSINVPSLSEKDRTFIEWAADTDMDFVAHSFVRNKEDVLAIRNMLDARDSKCKIIAKIENQEGVDNIDEILDHVFGIMIARGDLGIEIPGPQIPHIQKELIQKAVAKRKAVIVATQMLHTMIDHPRPTRAEISDVANAIYDGTDAIMLSGETAYGKYPLESVQTMAAIAAQADSVKDSMRMIPDSVVTSNVAAHLTRSAVTATSDLGAKAIIADSKSGRTIRALAAYRPNKPVYAFCYDKATLRQISLCHGVEAFYVPPRKHTDEFLKDAVNGLLDSKKVAPEDVVVILAGNFGSDNGASFIEICEAGKLL